MYLEKYHRMKINTILESRSYKPITDVRCHAVQFPV